MGYRPEMPTTNTRIEAVKQRIAARANVVESEDNVLYINHNRPAAGGHNVPKSGEQGLRMNRKQRRAARRNRKLAEQRNIERLQYAMYAQEARTNSEAQREEARYWMERALEAEARNY